MARILAEPTQKCEDSTGKEGYPMLDVNNSNIAVQLRTVTYMRSRLAFLAGKRFGEIPDTPWLSGFQQTPTFPTTSLSVNCVGFTHSPVYVFVVGDSSRVPYGRRQRVWAQRAPVPRTACYRPPMAHWTVDGGRRFDGIARLGWSALMKTNRKMA